MTTKYELFKYSSRFTFSIRNNIAFYREYHRDELGSTSRSKNQSYEPFELSHCCLGSAHRFWILFIEFSTAKERLLRSSTLDVSCCCLLFTWPQSLP